MPEWFKTGGNIREQHSNIAAGVATDYEAKADGHYISALVVDPVSVKKVEAGVLKGFSIGIKNPRVTRDKSAANGRIVDGQIVEVSLVDRPANPNCQLMLAKSASGDDTVVQVENLIEIKEPDYDALHEGGDNSEPAEKDLYNRVKAEAKEKIDVYPSAYANAWLVREYKARGGKYKRKTKKALQSDITEEEFDMTTAQELVAVSKSFVPSDLLKFDQKTYDTARQALAQLIQIEAKEMEDGSTEEMSISHLLEAVHHLFVWYAGEEEEGEIMEETVEMSADKGAYDKSTIGCTCPGCTKCGKAGGCKGAMCKMHDTEKNITQDTAANGAEDLIVAEKSAKEIMPNKGESLADFKARCKEAGMDDDYAKECYTKYTAAEEDKEKSATMDKCLECGCHRPEETHGQSDVTTADMVSPSETPKSAEADEEVTEEVTPDNSADDEPADLNAIVEQVVESATKALKSEIASLVSAKEAALAKAVGLETELAQAKSLAVAGGPKRTARLLGGTSNELVLKAATYKAKANAATDPDLAKGYRALADKFYAEATDTLNK